MKDLATVVLDLAVRLRSALRRQQVRSGEERPGTHFQPGAAERQAGVAQGRIHDLVLELQIRKADAVGKAPSVEVNPEHVLPGNIFVVIH